MSVSFAELVSRAELERTTSNVDLRKYNSECPTLTNTPMDTPHHSRLSSPAPNFRKYSMSDSLQKSQSTLRQYPRHELNISWMSAVLVTCFFCSGMIDAVAFNSWNCFVGMQTGNTVFVALGISHLPQAAHEHQYFKSLTAIGAFCMGAIFFNLLHRWPTTLLTMPTSRNRAIFFVSFFVQTSLIAISAGLVTGGIVSNQDFAPGVFSSGSLSTSENRTANYADLIPIALLAFEAAGQVCLSRNLAVIELPTIVLSTLYHDWSADLLGIRQSWKESTGVWNFLRVTNLRQEKRLMSIFALFLGALAGGEMYKSPARMAGALWLACGLKAGITLAFLLWPPQPAPEEKESSAV